MTDRSRPLEPEVLPPEGDARGEYGDRVVTWRTPQGWTVTVPVREAPPPPPPKRSLRLPILLFVATCLTTFLANGLVYAAAIMTILLAHEMGHYVQARRYDVPASPPYFIPMPFPPLGTLGAVILMRPRATTLQRLYDVAISGPLAGLGPALLASGWGITLSETVPVDRPDGAMGLQLGEPLVFRWLVAWLVEVPEGHTLLLHPLAFAGWVGIFVTALNLLPIGQLDGGHILYSLAPRAAPRISLMLVAFAAVVIVWQGYWHWTLMLMLIVFFALRHPPVRRDSPPLDLARQILGWATLAFLPLGFTPVPFILE